MKERTKATQNRRRRRSRWVNHMLITTVSAAMAAVIAAFMIGGVAFAVAVPEISIDASSYQYRKGCSGTVSGTISPAVGQTVRLYYHDRKRVLGTAKVSANGGKATFSIRVAESTLRGRDEINLFVKVSAAGGVAASKYLQVRMKRVDSSAGSGSASKTAATKKAASKTVATKKVTAKTAAKTVATKKVTAKTAATKKVTAKTAATKKTKKTKKTVAKKPAAKTFKIIYYGNGGTIDATGSDSFTVMAKVNSTTKTAANRFKRKDYIFKGWATVSTRGWLTGDRKNRKIAGKVNMKRFQLGKVAFKAKASVKSNRLYSTGSGDTVRLYAVWMGRGPKAACDWAEVIAADDRFNYGRQSTRWHGSAGGKSCKRQHMTGCYFCGTNRDRYNGAFHGKEAKPGSRWDRTWCCNPFISAAYTHGANHKLRGRCIHGNMDYSSWTRYNNKRGRFRKIGKVSTKKLKVGDIFFSGNHVWMYAGDGYRVESTGSSWSKDSIRVKKGIRMGSARGVLRYYPR